MKLNRRNFLKFLGKTTVASGVAVVTGLPEIPEGILDLREMENQKAEGFVESWTENFQSSFHGQIEAIDDNGKISYLNTDEFTSP